MASPYNRLTGNEETNWYQLKAKQVFARLRTSPSGLDESAVAKRLEKYGPNSLPKEKLHSWVYFLFSQFNDVFIYILSAAAIISIAFDNLIDFYVIIVVILTDVTLGFVQEYRANRELSRLRQLVAPQAVVRRGRIKEQIPAGQLVPGDIIYLQLGEKAPADARLIRAVDLKMDEAILTGESYPAKKQVVAISRKKSVGDRANLVFSGTTVVDGSGKAIVVATGQNAQIGQISTMVKSVKQERTPLQKRINGFARFIGLLTATLVLVIVIIGILAGQTIFDVFILAVALAVAAIPEGVVIGVTVVLAIGMSRILRKKALARKLVAAETLGSTTLIGMDKTGTLTEGKMRVSEIITLKKRYSYPEIDQTAIRQDDSLRNIFVGSVVGSESFLVNPKADPAEFEASGNPTENALVIAAAQQGYFEDELARAYPKIKTIPFDPDQKFSLSQNWWKNGKLVFIKGSPEKIIEMLGAAAGPALPESTKNELLKQVSQHAAQGFRLLAFAHGTCGPDIRDIAHAEKLISRGKLCLSFDGIALLLDPVRKSVKSSLKRARAAGLRVAIITGDHPNTVSTIAKKLRIDSGEKIMLGAEIEKLSDAGLEAEIDKSNVFARVSPKDKLRLIRAWQRKGEVVAMTGDGVNDAPAIKIANIGIAVGSAADVTKEAADLVLLDNNFKTIVAAIQEGRGIYQNIKKIILYLISDSFSEAIVVVGSFFVGLPLPILAVQILWNNLIAHGLPDLALTVDPYNPASMKQKPVNPREPIMDRKMKILTLVISCVHGLSVLLVFFLVWRSSADLALARTVAFASLGVDSLLYVFSIRDLRRSFFKADFTSNIYLLLTVFFGLGLQLVSIYLPFLQNLLRTVPLKLEHWGLVAIMALTVLASVEITKIIFNLAEKRRAQAKEKRPAMREA